MPFSAVCHVACSATDILLSYTRILGWKTTLKGNVTHWNNIQLRRHNGCHNLKIFFIRNILAFARHAIVEGWHSGKYLLGLCLNCAKKNPNPLALHPNTFIWTRMGTPYTSMSMFSDVPLDLTLFFIFLLELWCQRGKKSHETPSRSWVVGYCRNMVTPNAASIKVDPLFMWI